LTWDASDDMTDMIKRRIQDAKDFVDEKKKAA
jgi:hypothetical protein